jgi:hypothetical protein
VTGDRLIHLATAAVVSYSHIYDPGRVHPRRGHLSLPAGNQSGELSGMNDIAVYQ